MSKNSLVADVNRDLKVWDASSGIKGPPIYDRITGDIAIATASAASPPTNEMVEFGADFSITHLDSYLGCQVKLSNFLFPLKEEHYLLQVIVKVGRNNLRFLIYNLLVLCFRGG